MIINVADKELVSKEILMLLNNAILIRRYADKQEIEEEIIRRYKSNN